MPLDLTQQGAGTFPTFVSVTLIDSLATIVLIVVVVGVFWKYLQLKRVFPPKLFHAVSGSLGTGSIFRIFFGELLNRVVLQRDLIHKDDLRLFTHLAMFWGFVGLSVTTALAFIYNEPGNYIPLSGGALSPIRWLGNVSGVVMVLGASITIARLIGVRKFRIQRTFGDVWFSSLLFLSGVTGFVTEYWGDQAYAVNPNIAPAAAYSLSFSASPLIVIPYGIHLAAIGLLLVTAPFSAFIHAFKVPGLRYINRLGNLLSLKTVISDVDEFRKFKETAMEDELQRRYEEEHVK